MISIIARAFAWSLASLFIVIAAVWIGGPLLLVPTLFLCAARRLKFFPTRQAVHYRLTEVIHGRKTISGAAIKTIQVFPVIGLWFPLSCWGSKNRMSSDRDHAAAVARLDAGTARQDGVLSPGELSLRTAGRQS